MISPREYQREVTANEDSVKFAMGWLQWVLREWHATHEVALLTVTEPRRTLSQNDKMWPMLADVSRQVEWVIDGEKTKPEPEDWKHILSAGLRRHQRVAAGIDGGFVILGQSTRRLSKSEFSDLIEIIYEFGSRHNVVWSEPAKKAYEKYRNKRRAA